MPFTSYEQSLSSGRPIQFYQFLRSSGGVDVYWRYNSSDIDITYAGYVFSALTISDDGVRLNGEAASSDLQVHMPITAQFCHDFRLGGASPSDTVYLRIYLGHVGDIETGVLTDARLHWIGTVDGITQTGDIDAKVTCSMLPASLRRTGLRYGYMHTCPHMLYDPSTCKVDKELFKTVGTIVAIDGNRVQAVEFDSNPAPWFNGGFIEYTLGSGLTERRMIRFSSGEWLTLLGVPVGLSVGDSVNAFAGCARTISVCVDKFDNLLNNGSFPHMPGRSPFDGNPVF